MVCVCAIVCASTSGFGRGRVGILVLVLPRASRTSNGAPRLGRGGIGCTTHPRSAKKQKRVWMVEAHLACYTLLSVFTQLGTEAAYRTPMSVASRYPPLSAPPTRQTELPRL